MNEAAIELIKLFPGRPQLYAFAEQLKHWLEAELDEKGEGFSESRARALLLAGNLMDEPTRNDYATLVTSEAGTRVALYDLLAETGLDESDEVKMLGVASAQSPVDSDRIGQPAWLALTVAAFAWRSDFPLNQLDPSSPPEAFSPAGQVLKRSAAFVRQQIQRSATEREKLNRQLGYDASAGATTLEGLPVGVPAAPLPPYYRPPIPVSYPEHASETVRLDDDEMEVPATVSREDAIAIDEDDLEDRATGPAILPAIRIDEGEIEPLPPPPPAQGNVILPAATTATGSASRSPRGRSRRRKATQVTRLNVVVQEYPDGPALYGLQVKVSSRAIRRYVAGTTNKDGRFLCELPVRSASGLTYDVDITWPSDFGGGVERKSITLNADRTSFTLPFYRKHNV